MKTNNKHGNHQLENLFRKLFKIVEARKKRAQVRLVKKEEMESIEMG